MPAFDPSQPFEVDDGRGQFVAFDPNQPFETIDSPEQVPPEQPGFLQGMIHGTAPESLRPHPIKAFKETREAARGAVPAGVEALLGAPGSMQEKATSFFLPPPMRSAVEGVADFVDPAVSNLAGLGGMIGSPIAPAIGVADRTLKTAAYAGGLGAAPADAGAHILGMAPAPYPEFTTPSTSNTAANLPLEFMQQAGRSPAGTALMAAPLLKGAKARPPALPSEAIVQGAAETAQASAGAAPAGWTPKISENLLSALKSSNKEGKMVEVAGEEMPRFEADYRAVAPEVAKSNFEFKGGKDALVEGAKAVGEVKNDAYGRVKQMLGENDLELDTTPVSQRLHRLADHEESLPIHDPSEIAALREMADGLVGKKYNIQKVEDQIIRFNQKNAPFYNATEAGQKSKLGSLEKQADLEAASGFRELIRNGLDDVGKGLGEEFQRQKNLYGSASRIYVALKSRIPVEGRQQLLSLNQKVGLTSAAGDLGLALLTAKFTPQYAMGKVASAGMKAGVAAYLKYLDTSGYKFSKAINELRLTYPKGSRQVPIPQKPRTVPGQKPARQGARRVGDEVTARVGDKEVKGKIVALEYKVGKEKVPGLLIETQDGRIIPVPETAQFTQ